MNKRPKRRKYDGNPYTLLSCDDKYYIQFIDNFGNNNIVNVSLEVFMEFDKFELEDISQAHKFDRHIEHSVLEDYSLYNRALNKQGSIETIIENKILIDEIKESINDLSIIQKRRIKMYYFENKTLKEIARKEKCSIMSVKDSIDLGIKKIIKKLKF